MRLTFSGARGEAREFAFKSLNAPLKFLISIHVERPRVNT